MIDEGLYQLVMQNKSAIGLVGGFWPNVLPEEPTFPAGTFSVIGGNSQPTFTTSGMQRVRLQMDWFGDTASAARNTYWAARAILEGFQGVLPNGIAVDNLEHIQFQSMFDDAPRKYRVMSEFYAFFTLP